VVPFYEARYAPMPIPIVMPMPIQIRSKATTFLKGACTILVPGAFFEAGCFCFHDELIIGLVNRVWYLA